MNSFQDSVKAKIPADTMPGRASGKAIRQSAPSRRGAVDARALLQLSRNGAEVACHQPGENGARKVG